MIDCFQDLVGIKTDCGEQNVSISGLYLQDLPFINLKVADAIVTNQESGYQLLQDKLNIAGNYLLNDIQTRMLPYFRMNTVIENDIAGFYLDNMVEMPPIPDNLVGIQLRVDEYPFLSVLISSISLFVKSTGSVNLFVYDLTQSKLLDTISVETVESQLATIEINKTYQTNGQYLNLFIGYLSDDIISYQSNVFGLANGNNCRGCGNRRSRSNKYTYVYGKSIAENAQKIQQNLGELNGTGGLSITYSLNCSLEKWLCQNKNYFGMALMFRAGMEILKEFNMSSRINALVTLRKEEATNLEQYFEAEYNKSMTNVLNNLRLPNDICFKCIRQLGTGVV